MPIQPGVQLGPYEVRDVIGRGAMGVVFRAYHAGLGREVAIKVLQVVSVDAEAAARFRQEAKAIAQLRHPNILQVFDFGDFEGVPYMVVELMPGGSLADRLRTGTMGREEFLQVFQPLASALDHAHEMGIIHRDIKPANVLRNAQGGPVLADFGLAKFSHQSGVRTMTGMTTGTPAYMSPEQATGKGIGPAADRYSFAVMAYEALCGTTPFSGEGAMELLYAHVHLDPPPPSQHRSDLGAAVDAIFRRALAKQAADRWESCQAMVTALREAFAGRPASALRPPLAPAPTVPSGSVSPLLATRRPARRTWWPVLAAAALGLLVVVAGAVMALRPPSASPVLALSTSTSSPGDTIVVSGRHMPADTLGTIRFDSRPIALTTFRTDAGGSFSASVRLPADVVTGDHLVKACWDASCPVDTVVHLLTAATPRPTSPSTPLPATAPPTPEPSTSPTPRGFLDFSPASPRPGSTIDVSAGGFTQYSRVVAFIEQSSTQYPLKSGLTAASDGTVRFNATVPASLKAGTGQLYVCNQGSTQTSVSNCQRADLSIQ